MIIRQATIEDASAITGLLRQLGHPLREEDVERKIHFFSQNDCRVLVCEISGRPEGFIQ